MISKKETPRDVFIELVKKSGKVRASLSHTQTFPCRIDWSAVVDIQWDGNLFTTTWDGKRAEIDSGMPAFHLWEDDK